MTGRKKPVDQILVLLQLEVVIRGFVVPIPEGLTPGRLRGRELATLGIGLPSAQHLPHHAIELHAMSHIARQPKLVL